MQKLPNKNLGSSWNLARKRRAYEILQLAKRRRKRATVPPPSDPVELTLLDGLAGYWKLEEESGQVRLDSSGNGFDLSDNNNVSQMPGRIGYGAECSFLGYDRWLDHPDDPLLRFDGDFTISCWVYVTGSTFGGDTIINSTSSVFFYTNSELKPQLVIYDDFTNAIVDLVGTVSLNDDAWHHLAFYRNGQTFGVVVDAGIPETVSDVVGLPHTGDMFRIGANEAGYPFTGVIDEVGKWNRALSADEITALYNGGAGLAVEEF